jgi:hypothetical protein
MRLFETDGGTSRFAVASIPSIGDTGLFFTRGGDAASSRVELEGERYNSLGFRWFVLPFFQGSERCIDQNRMSANDVCAFDFAIRADNDFDFNRADQAQMLCDFRVSWSWLGNRFSRFLAGCAGSSRT